RRRSWCRSAAAEWCGRLGDGGHSGMLEGERVTRSIRAIGIRAGDEAWLVEPVRNAWGFAGVDEREVQQPRPSVLAAAHRLWAVKGGALGGALDRVLDQPLGPAGRLLYGRAVGQHPSERIARLTRAATKLRLGERVERAGRIEHHHPAEPLRRRRR